jgi:hypothetical protein
MVSVEAGPKGKVRTRAAPPPKPTPRAMTVDLRKWLDNDAISAAQSPKDGNFDLPKLKSGSTFPAAHLPAPRSRFAPPGVPGVVFRFPDTADGAPNNIACKGQRIAVPQERYAQLWLLVAAESGPQTGALRLVHAAGEKAVRLQVSDWCSAPQFGEVTAVRSPERHTWKGEVERKACRIWAVSVPVGAEPLGAIVLPANPRIHVVAITLLRPAPSTPPDAREGGQ